MNNTQYTLLILEAYEDEVAGAAYFDNLARAYPQHSSFFQKCAALERTTANRLIELLRKYHLTPSTQTTLQERGALDARIQATSNWRMLMQQSIESYARYVAEFKALEEFIARRKQKHLLDLMSKLEWDAAFDYKAERSRR